MMKTLDLYSEIAIKFEELEKTCHMSRPSRVCEHTQDSITGSTKTCHLDNVFDCQNDYIQDLKALVLELEDRLSYVEGLIGHNISTQAVTLDSSISASPLLKNNTYTSIS